jgi:hypothetical protein
MCKIKNEQATDILRMIRAIEKNGIESIEIEELTAFYVAAYTLQKEIESVLEVAKSELMKAKIQESFYPDLERKIKIAEGKKTVSYNNLEVAKEIGVEAYAGITNIVAGRATDYADILAKHSIVKVGEPSISVSKMTKKELLRG